ncbi:NAD-dependent succinate-semialdehyde dehydrogenase [Pseudarthrobacter sp. NamE5]|uniref:NAD-dependent succinate-semialdehyde dehydrogenase n=1 Tax=Pseudarthrobacter sp. NamE5 TaxID=2576839 RepID=UPI00110BDC37|nr:NAD-dependent succinate-semialdehyde dehydrogenase [Pseudarthrobacter sp. NamE5]TLM80907.1 NAD-dependent succinate-semialdehyde dehydrogenase [Pseudarthrobacter sp. NamE5]
MSSGPTLDLSRSKLFIGGEWRHGRTGQTLPVINPATGEAFAYVADATVEDGLAALDAACTVQNSWAATPARVRADILARTYQSIIDRRHEFACLIADEMGKPWAEAQTEVDYSAGFFRWFAESAGRIHAEGQLGLEPGSKYHIAVSKRPVGPSLLITPWNFPLAMGARKIAPALAAGCTTVLKPAAQTPLTSLLLAQVLQEAGVPAGVINVVVTGNSRDLIAAIMKDQRTRKISFTGSTKVGKRLLAQAAQNVMNTSMELGGNAPLIVFDDADIEVALEGAFLAKLRNGGQSCVAANRIYVQTGIEAEFTAKFIERLAALRVGDPHDPNTVLGPLIDDKQRSTVHSLVTDAVTKGATCPIGGQIIEGAGYYYPATVLTDIPADAIIRKKEIFGPVAAIYTFNTELDVIDQANGTPYGLASYVFTQNLARALRVANAIDAGMTGINCGLISNPAAPFGGTKQSGLGREGGTEGLGAYQETKYTGIQL